MFIETEFLTKEYGKQIIWKYALRRDKSGKSNLNDSIKSITDAFDKIGLEYQVRRIAVTANKLWKGESRYLCDVAVIQAASDTDWVFMTIVYKGLNTE